MNQVVRKPGASGLTYRYPKRKPTNFQRVKSGDLCQEPGRALKKECLYPTAVDSLPNCQKFVRDPVTGAIVAHPDCDARLYKAGSFKTNPDSHVANMDALAKARLFFDRAKIRYGAAIGFRKLYSPYVLDPIDNVIMIDPDGMPVLKDGFVFLSPLDMKRNTETYKALRPYFPITKPKQDPRIPPSEGFRGPVPITEEAIEMWRTSKRYHYQSEALIKTAGTLLKEACAILNAYLSQRGVSPYDKMVGLTRVISKESIKFFVKLMGIMIINNIPSYIELFDNNYLSFLWEPLMHEYPTGKDRTKPVPTNENIILYFNNLVQFYPELEKEEPQLMPAEDFTAEELELMEQI
jgi:hypothetical protein